MFIFHYFLRMVYKFIRFPHITNKYSSLINLLTHIQIHTHTHSRTYNKNPKPSKKFFYSSFMHRLKRHEPNILHVYIEITEIYVLRYCVTEWQTLSDVNTPPPSPKIYQQFCCHIFRKSFFFFFSLSLFILCFVFEDFSFIILTKIWRIHSNYMHAM